MLISHSFRVAVAAALFPVSALAHEVKTTNEAGETVTQTYEGYRNFEGTDCCNNQHCHPLDPSRYTHMNDGTVIIKPTQENAFARTIDPSSKLRATEPSTDGQFHECTTDGKGGGMFYCLITP